MSPEYAPFDHSGYGPTSTGFAPSAYDLRRLRANRFHSDRVSEAMQDIDPTLQSAALRIARATSGMRDDRSARDFLYGTARGQAIMDTARYARNAGMLGYGNVSNYAHNISSGISLGGMSMDIREGVTSVGRAVSGSGRLVGMSQRVSGNGMPTRHTRHGRGVGCDASAYA